MDVGDFVFGFEKVSVSFAGLWIWEVRVVAYLSASLLRCLRQVGTRIRVGSLG